MSGGDASVLQESVTQAFSDAVKNVLISAASRFPAFAARLIASVPQIFLFFVVTVLSAVYFCIDYEKIRAFLRLHLSKWHWDLVTRIGGVMKHTAVQFVKSYFLLFLITFAGLFFGFVLIREPYAFLFALLTAVVDGLPILGMGIVLFPLAVYHFMLGDIGYGIGICVIYLVLTVLRQVLEPRILGAGMGMHPLVMLMAMYCGWQVIGIGGMLLAPFVAVTVKNVIGIKKGAKSDPRNAEKVP
jgi:sporulation integral membrane protein YtvI